MSVTISDYENKAEFNEADIADRTKQLAQYAYSSVWVIWYISKTIKKLNNSLNNFDMANDNNK